MANTQTVQTADGVQIAYETAGAGPPLVFIHGITEHRRTWDDFVPQFQDDYQVILVDLRGHGESAKGEDYSAPTMAADVAAVTEALGVGPVHVVGHSLGGLVATAYAAFFPTRSAINIDQPFQLGEFKNVVLQMETALRGDGFLDALNAEMELLAGDALPASEKANLRALRANAQQDVVLALWEPLLTMTAEEIDASIAALLPAVRVPYLSLHGTDLGLGYATWLTGLIPTAVVETWDGLGHWLQLIEPERFVKRVRDFTAAAS